MMKKMISALLCGLFFLPGVGCTSSAPPIQPQPPSTEPVQTAPVDIPFQLPVYPDFPLHPAYAENRSNLVIASLLYEPLFSLDSQFQAQPVLCREYTVSEDGLVWTLILQEQVTFSDGTPLSGDVVADALNLIRKESSHYAQRLSNIRSVSGEEATVTITLTQPNSALPTLLDIPIALGEEEFPLGTGSYILSRSPEDWTLVAREDRWQNTALPANTIPLTFIAKSDDLVFSFDCGDISLVDVDLTGTNPLGYSGNYESWDYTTTSMLYLGYNTQHGPCKQVQLRQSIARSMDRESIAQVDFSRHAQPAALPLHPAHPLYPTELEETLRFAPELLEQAKMELTMVVNSENAARVAVAQRIAEQLTAAGWTVTLNKLSFEDYTTALRQGNFDLYLAEVVLTADFDLSALLLPQGTLNFGLWDDPDTQQLLQTFRAAPPQQQPDAATALYTHLAQQVPIAPICFKNNSVLTRWGQVSGLAPVRGNVFYQLENWTINKD